MMALKPLKPGDFRLASQYNDLLEAVQACASILIHGRILPSTIEDVPPYCEARNRLIDLFDMESFAAKTYPEGTIGDKMRAKDKKKGDR